MKGDGRPFLSPLQEKAPYDDREEFIFAFNELMEDVKEGLNLLNTVERGGVGEVLNKFGGILGLPVDEPPIKS